MVVSDAGVDAELRGSANFGGDLLHFVNFRYWTMQEKGFWTRNTAIFIKYLISHAGCGNGGRTIWQTDGRVRTD